MERSDRMKVWDLVFRFVDINIELDTMDEDLRAIELGKDYDEVFNQLVSYLGDPEYENHPS